MVMLKKCKGLLWPFWGLALASALDYMAGLAALQASCGTVNSASNGVAPAGMFGYSAFGASDPGCAKIFRFYWFIFAFVFVTLLGVLIASVMQLGLQWTRPFWVGMLSICIVLMMIASEFFLGYDVVSEGSGWSSARWGLATAGAIMSVVSLVLLLLAVGTDWDRYGHGSHQRGIDDKVAGRGTTTTTTERVGAPVGNVRVVDQV